MKKLGYIPGSPLLNWGMLCPKGRGSWGRLPLFSYARYGMLSFLEYLKRKGALQSKGVLFPNLMCKDVCEDFRRAGYPITFYPIEEDFSVSLPSLQNALHQTEGVQVVVVAHFYGKVVPGLSAIASFCRGKGLFLLVDSVHLPFPFLWGEKLGGDAHFYSLRKTYPFPLGGVALVAEEHEEFYEEIRRSSKDQKKRWGEPSWFFRQMAKRFLFRCQIPFSQKREEVLPRNNLPPWASPLLWSLFSEKMCADAVKKRRENYSLYLKHERELQKLGALLRFGPEDVPYQLVFFLHSSYPPKEVISSLRKRGIPALSGILLDAEVEKSLPKEHFLKSILTLPLHQDLSEKEIEKVVSKLLLR